MGMMTRILRLWKADIHGVMDQFEDKELLLKQYLREMEGNLELKEEHFVQLGKSQKQLKLDLAARRQEIEKLEMDLTLALQKNKDDIARLLIRKQRSQQKHCDHLKQQGQTIKDEEDQLLQILEQQRLQYETLKIKATTYCRQSEQAKFYESDTVFHETTTAYSVGDEEIELELIRRKEQLKEAGGTT